MRQYLVVAHHTLGGTQLMDRLHGLRVADHYCRFRLVVPRFRSDDQPYDPVAEETTARRALDDILNRMASMGIGAVGETGDTDPVAAVGDALAGIDRSHVGGIVVSTKPLHESRWWQGDVPDRLQAEYPDIPVFHVVADEVPVG